MSSESKEPPPAARRKPLNKTQQKGNVQPVAKRRSQRDLGRRALVPLRFGQNAEANNRLPDVRRRRRQLLSSSTAHHNRSRTVCKKQNIDPGPDRISLPLRVSSPQELTGRRRLSPLGR